MMTRGNGNGNGTSTMGVVDPEFKESVAKGNVSRLGNASV